MVESSVRYSPSSGAPEERRGNGDGFLRQVSLVLPTIVNDSFTCSVGDCSDVLQPLLQDVGVDVEGELRPCPSRRGGQVEGDLRACSPASSADALFRARPAPSTPARGQADAHRVRLGVEVGEDHARRRGVSHPHPARQRGAHVDGVLHEDLALGDPERVVLRTATAVERNRVSRSGSLNVTVTVPSFPVTSPVLKTAVGLKFLLTFTPAPPPAPPHPSRHRRGGRLPSR